MILELYDTPAGKPLIETLLNKLAGTTSSPIMDQAKLMVDSAREFNVLREVRREVGTDALAASIEDAKNNSSKLNRAITQTYEKLRTHYNEAKTPAEKERIAKVMTMLREQAENDVPGQVMRATLTPFTLGGKTMDYVSGKGIADMIEKTDPESFEDEAVDNKFGADIITQ